MADNMLSALEGQLEALGKSLEGTIEEWQTAEAGKRTELESKIKGLEAGIGELRETIKEEKRFHLPGVEAAKGGERDAFSLARACRAIASKSFDNAPYEQEVFQNMRSKALSQGLDSAGGYIVPEEAILSVIEKLKAQVVAFDLGATEMQCTGVPCVIPKISTSATAYWVNENSTITESPLVFDQISLSPKTVAGRVVLSNLLLETSQPSADTIIEQDLAQQLGLAVDSAVLKGGGTGEPTGIMADSFVTKIDTDLTSTTAPTVAQLLEFPDTLMSANALRGSLGWVLHPKALTQIRQIKSENATLGTPNLEVSRFMLGDGPLNTLLGYPYRVSTQMTAPAADDDYSMLFGNFSDVMVARWGGLRLLASNTSDDAFSKDQTHIRATMRMDVGLRHPESFAYSFTA